MGRGVAIALSASLALNCLAAGYLVGREIAGGPDRPAPQGLPEIGGPRMAAAMARGLPPESRDAFRAAMRDRLPQMRAEHEKTVALRAELRALLTADSWDEDAVLAKFAEIRGVRIDQMAAFDAAFVSALGAIPADDRRRLIELSEERFGGSFGPGEGDPMRGRRMDDRRMNGPGGPPGPGRMDGDFPGRMPPGPPPPNGPEMDGPGAPGMDAPEDAPSGEAQPEDPPSE